MRFQGQSVVSCEIALGAQRTPLIRAYVLISTIYKVPDIEEAINRFPGRDPIVMWYLNVDISRLQNSRRHHMEYFLVYFGLVDLIDCFRQKLHFRYMKLWRHFHQGKFIC